LDTLVKSGSTPREGDFFVCMSCAQILRFDGLVELRIITAKDLDELRQMPPNVRGAVGKAVREARIIQREARVVMVSQMLLEGE
jgi:hypothetical protein